MRARLRVIVLGAGFGGLELTTVLSDAFGDAIDVVLIDKSEAFVLGFSKLDVMFGRQMPADARHPYRHVEKPGVRFLRSIVRSIDPATRRVVTDNGTFEAEVMVVALGADLDPAATPGLAEGGNEFYSVPAAFALRDVLPRFEGGPAIIGVTGKSFKCPPAPSETALLLDDYLTARGRRQATEISVVMPFGSPIPPSPETSQAILAAFTERGIRFVKDRLVRALYPGRKVAVLSDGTEMPYELFLGVPVHRVPQVVVESGLAANADAWVPVNKKTLETNFPGVYAVGVVNGVGTAKAGVFAEAAARVAAAAIIAQLRGGPLPEAYKGAGSCYLEFGHGQVGRVDVDFLSGPNPTGTFQEPTEALAREKAHFGSGRIQRWFGRPPGARDSARALRATRDADAHYLSSTTNGRAKTSHQADVDLAPARVPIEAPSPGGSAAFNRM